MFKRYKVNIIIRIITIVSLVLAFVYLVSYTEFYITVLAVGLMIIGTVWDLVRYTDQTNRDIAAFLLGIKYEDFSVTFTGKHKGQSFGELYQSFNEVNNKFREIQAEKEAQFQYLQTIVENVGVGLLCIDEDGEVLLMNKALKDLIKKPYLVNASSLNNVDERLLPLMNKMSSGDSELVKINVDNKLVQLSMQATEFKLRGKYYKLISMRNIQSELEEQELIAWQKLIRILTHEIMNSVTPIVSLTGAMDDMLGRDTQEFSPTEIVDMRQAIKAIKKRSEGLLHFTETYRTLTKIPPPTFERINGKLLIDRIHTLFKIELREKNIQLEKILPNQDLFFQADPELIEQVLINLIKNAIHAVQDSPDPRITLILQKQNDDKTSIRVADNGSGIEEEILDQIFVPFFTTKKEGSGIGLNLSRQIIRMHKGTLTAQSVVGQGTVFTITL